MTELLKNLSYEDAMKQIDAIISQLESGSIEVDQMANVVERAQSLLTYCENKLRQIEAKIKDKPT